MISKHGSRLQHGVVGLLVACMVGMVAVAQALAVESSQVLIQVNIGEAVTIPVEKVQAVAIADPAIADVATLSDKELSVIGKKVGVTTLTVSHTEGPTEVRRVEVGYDLPAATIRRIIGMPDVDVRIIGNTLVLDGKVTDELQAARAAQVASAYSEKVLNLLEVTNPRQVRIRNRIVEVRKEAIKQIGIEYLRDGVVRYGYGRIAIEEGGNETFAGHAFLNPTAVADESISLGDTPIGVEATLRLLQQKNFVRVLSEPTLVTLSGKEASFLAGGEAPIVQQLQNTFTVEFKEFGVRMKIKPTADSANNISSHLVAEVSDVNPAVTVQGVPSFTTRRAETDVQLKDGQTLAIGGLFSNNHTRDAIRKVPWLGDIPVLGALFRSKDFQNNQSELLFFVTMEIVKDIDAETGAAARTPSLQEWNSEKANKDVLELPKDHDLVPEMKRQPAKADTGAPRDEKASTSNYTPARPAAP